MKTAKDEFLKHTEGKEILCAWVELYERVDLPINYTKFQFIKFLSLIDVEYDSGYGSQELYGIIWYKDGTWSERGEYDGSEWWEYNCCPETPVFLHIQTP